MSSVKNNYADETAENNTTSNPTRNPDGSLKLRNPNTELMKEDVLYHLALATGSHNLQHMFGDVKFVCMGGTAKRMHQFAYHVMEHVGYKLPIGSVLEDITVLSQRFAMYKVGPVLSVSHGMGISSISILIHEMIKLMYHAKAKDPIFIRIGTSGGIGLDGGNIVVANGAVDSRLRDVHEQIILGKLVQRPAILDKKLAQDILSAADPNEDYKVVTGKTMCTADFYEEQGRLDGAICEITEAEKIEYLTTLKENGVVNIEMEATVFAALTHYVGIKASIVCVTFLDRLKGDQVTTPKSKLDEWQQRPSKLVARYIKKYLEEKVPKKCNTGSFL